MASDPTSRIRDLYNLLTDLGADAAKRAGPGKRNASRIDRRKSAPRPTPAPAGAEASTAEATLQKLDSEIGNLFAHAPPSRTRIIFKDFGSSVSLVVAGWSHLLLHPLRVVAAGILPVSLMTIGTAYSLQISVLNKEPPFDLVYGRVILLFVIALTFGFWVRVGWLRAKSGARYRIGLGETIGSLCMVLAAFFLVTMPVLSSWSSLDWAKWAIASWPQNGAYALAWRPPGADQWAPTNAISIEPFVMTLCLAPMSLLVPIFTGEYKKSFTATFKLCLHIYTVLLAITTATIPICIVVWTVSPHIARLLNDHAFNKVGVILSLLLYLHVSCVAAIIGESYRRTIGAPP